MDEILMRYGLSPSEVITSIWPMPSWLLPVTPGSNQSPTAGAWNYIFQREPDRLLSALPDVEFLAALEAGVTANPNPSRRLEWFSYIDRVLAINRLPYRVSLEAFRFEWVGDDFTHTHSIEPVLAALRDPRLQGADNELREALHKRASGANKDLEDAIDEAAKAVESTLRALYNAHWLQPPKRRQLRPLFDGLVKAAVLPGYVDHLISAPAGPRNNMASHGQGETVRTIPVELADASIAAAATAITFLSHFLPAAPGSEEPSAPSANPVEEF